MNAKQLFESISPNTKKYLIEKIYQHNKNDKVKLQKLFQNGVFTAKSFEDSNINILEFDWQNVNKDRNWWWQIQALPFLNWYCNSFEILEKNEKQTYLNKCEKAIQRWMEKAEENPNSPLVWHDHATAFRVRSIVDFLVFCVEKSVLDETSPFYSRLATLVIKHLEWLAVADNFSKHTNHGFDQAMIALSVTLIFDSSELLKFKNLNRSRLKEEIEFAFTEEGIHKENSPGYQKVMLQRLKQLEILDIFGEHEIFKLSKKYIEKAESFLSAITLPNGYLPMIGDTRGGDKGINYKQKNEIDTLIFENSGYAIVRGKVLGKDFHLIFKASHLSHYHRHDDDLSLHLFFDGKVLLGDGGLGSHNERDKKRVSLRSPLCHNVPYLANKAARRKVKDLDGSTPCISIVDGRLIGRSFSFGPKFTREIDLRILHKGKITIMDRFEGVEDNKILVNYYSAENICSLSDDLLITRSKDHALRISFSNIEEIEEIETFSSEKYGVFNKKFSYSIRPQKKSYLETNLDLCHIKDDLFSIHYRGYGPIVFEEAGDWFFDDLYPANVCHHIMSLRWLNQITSAVIKEKVVKSFLAYHKYPNNKKSKFYLGREADHTASIRMIVILNYLQSTERGSLYNVQLKKELLKTVRSCLNETYKKNNNHGLMVDKALLKVLFTDSYFLKKDGIDIQFVLNRVNNQLNAIFDEEGFCKEHSISYQEYNLGIALELLDVMSIGTTKYYFSEIDALIERVEKIKQASRKSLGYLLKDDEKYITIGDSFPEPKTHILKKAFGSETPTVALSPESKEDGVFHNQTLGVSVFRSSKLHFAMNASWHSYVHKQNDDLGIFLRVNGEDVIIDGGYSDIVSLSKVDTRSEYLHSTIIPFGIPWKNRGQADKGFSRLDRPVCEAKKVTLSGVHNRVLGCEVSRHVVIRENEKTIKIKDELDQNNFCIHRFIIPNNFKFSIQGNSILLKSKLNNICVNASFYSALSKNNNNSPQNLEIGWRSLTGVSGIVNNSMQEHLALEFVSNGKVEFLVSYE